MSKPWQILASKLSFEERENEANRANRANRARAVTPEAQLTSCDSQLSADEVDIVELCFKGLGSEVHVSDSAIDLYKRNRSCGLKAAVIDSETAVSSTSISAANTGLDGGSTTASIDPLDWMYIATGVPLLIRDIGQSKARSKKCLKIVVAERGSCFVLLHDVFDHSTNYKHLKNNFHSFRLSNRCTEIGFEFRLESAAAQFLLKVNEWAATADSAVCATGTGFKKTCNRKSEKQQPKPTSKRMPLPPKETISQPCCFRHLISVDKTDDYFALKKHFSSLL